MTIHTLIEKLQVVALEHGYECEVVVLDGEGEWPLSVHVEPEVFGEVRRMIVCIAAADMCESTPTEQQNRCPDVTDIPPSNYPHQPKNAQPERF